MARAPTGLADDAPLLLVPDPLAALAALGRAARDRSSARIAAVTGSVGKTGSKEMLSAALAAYGPTVASKGNLNNHIGAPLSLARLDRQAAFAVFELGMNHPDEIRPLARLVRPHAALITNVEMVHAGFFTGIEQIADAKAEILEGIEVGGAAVLNRDNGQFERLAAHARRLAIARVVTFGAGAEADARLLDAASSGDGTRVTAEIDGSHLSWTVGGIGLHWALNSLGVAATLHALGLDPAIGTAALAGVSAMRGRGGQVRLDLPGGPVTLIDESYNASPPAVRAALAVFAGNQPRRRRTPDRGAWRHAGAWRDRRRRPPRARRGGDRGAARRGVPGRTGDARPRGRAARHSGRRPRRALRGSRCRRRRRRGAR